jgi:exopolysaccharide biosynthesis polyprenyl glycosylphosphotransferase
MSTSVNVIDPSYARRDVGLPERLLMTALLCDTLVVVYGLAAGFWLRFYTPIAKYGVPTEVSIQSYAGFLVFGALLMLFMLTNYGLYKKQTLLRYRHVSMLVLKSGLIWFAGFIGFALVFKFQAPISRLFVTLASINVIAGLLIWRNLFHRVLRNSPAAAQLKQRVLFVGWSEDTEHLARSFQADDACAYQVAGCAMSRRGSFERTPPENVDVFECVHEIENLIHRENIDIVILSDLDCARSDIVALANVCEKEMVQFKVVPSYFQILVSGLHLETVNGVPVLGVSQLPLDKLQNVILKRTIDFAGALIGLILCVPIIAVFSVLVYRESPGPIFYRARRLGLRGREFDMFKIRSMRLYADREGTGHWTLKDDPRRLKIGGFIRKWNIDELPQFWNVLKGDMSLVGPRPESVELIKSFKEEIPHYNARHNVKSGITGWAQVNGLRGDTDLTERIKCDLWYLENWNPLLDFQIMFMTLMKNKNAG